MNNLAFDFGNSLTKAALFKGSDLVEVFRFPGINNLDQILELVQRLQPERIIFAEVVDLSADLIAGLKSNTNQLIRLNDRTVVPFQMGYQTPETLGQDRMALAAGASKMADGNSVLAIQTGSCITYNFIDSDNVFQGGAITPGLKMRLKSLNHFTEKLPLLELENEASLTGSTTNQSILSGIVNGATYEMDGFIEAYKKFVEPLEVILSGGDTPFFENKLKNRIFADQNLVLRGLNQILIMNDE